MQHEHTPTPWRHVQLVNSDGSNMTPVEIGDYVCRTAAHGERPEFNAIQATKEDGKLYDICHVGNGPDSPWNAAHIVKCVNYHERLVEALREAKEFMEVELTGTAWADCKHMAHSIDKLLTELENNQ